MTASTVSTRHRFRLIVLLAVLAGIIYNSWLFGYWLNPQVARHDLASELEGLHQPFNWLFIVGDIICGSLIMLIAYRLRRRRSDRIYAMELLSYASFGLFTLLDALLPLDCDPSSQSCPITLHDPLLIAHGFFSIAASVGLFLAIALLWWRHRQSILLQITIWGYLILAAFSIVSIITPGQDSWSQHYSLLLDGLCIVVVPVIILSQLPYSKSRRASRRH